eukprot:gnl/Dysnectes_brevis/641_a708_7169.p1 GENE.gnl/Dysnectes_brevis/641_a708_7169~~gnl/Dysnectes_brevis/641_a708_7169.p1  ORF type:complete len:220 (+),score=41.23 gnl/Dysnectes_brevis/641_a708_7169:46-660(+)
MGAYRFVNELWKKKQTDVMRFLTRVRVWEFRQLPSLVRVAKPTRPEKARRLGYKARQGVLVYRVRIRRGGRKRNCFHGISYGKPRNIGIRQVRKTQSLQAFAEIRAGNRLGGLRVMSSYFVGQDGSYKWFEVIMVDPAHTAVRMDTDLNWICKPVMKRRECRGLTSSGKSARGLRNRGVGAMKLRPSRRATWKKHQTVSLRRYR